MARRRTADHRPWYRHPYRYRRRGKHGLANASELHCDRGRSESGLAIARSDQDARVRDPDHYFSDNTGESKRTVSDPTTWRSRGERKAKIDGDLRAARPRSLVPAVNDSTDNHSADGIDDQDGCVTFGDYCLRVFATLKPRRRVGRIPT